MLLSCRWATAGRLPYFSNLKVMRKALGAVRAAVEDCGGTLGAYLFFDDEFRFLAQGPRRCPGGQLQAALQAGGVRAAAEFEASDRKELWGAWEQERLLEVTRDAAVDELLRAPVDAGLAPSPGDYPWCGGPWLLARAR